MSERLLRITAVAGGRRSDLAVPGGVPVAELVPDLARAVGLLDPAAVYAGYGLHAHGRRLQLDRGLREQGVDDGALLAVTSEVYAAAPPTHDDLAEATAEAVGRQPAWQTDHTRRTTLLAGVLALTLGLGALTWNRVPADAAAIALALVVLLGNALPAVAVAVGAGRLDAGPVDPVRVAAMVARSARLLRAGSATVGVATVVLVPVVADGAAGVALAADCCAVLLLRARRHRAFAQALIDVAGGLAGLTATALALLLRDPDARSALAAALAGTGIAAGALARLPSAPSVVRARAADLLENVALVAIAPLLLLATDGLARVS